MILKNVSIATTFALIFLFSTVYGQSKKTQKFELKTKEDSISYAIGMDIGVNLKSQNIEIIPASLAQGIIDLINKNDLLITEDVKFKIINDFQEAHTKKQQEMANMEAQKSKEAGKKFLEDNKKQEGVKITESGLQYKIIKEGSGKRPGPTSNVTVHYEGKLIDGTIFDSSYQRGESISFPLSGVIPGWTEGLQLMKEGGKAELYIPYELAYGERGAGNIIPGYSTLIFTVELIRIEE